MCSTVPGAPAGHTTGRLARPSHRQLSRVRVGRPLALICSNTRSMSVTGRWCTANDKPSSAATLITRVRLQLQWAP